MPKWVVVLAGVFIVSWFVFLVVCLASSISDFIHQTDGKGKEETNYEQLMRVDLATKSIEKDFFEEEVVISHPDLINELIPILINIKWHSKKIDIESKVPDVKLHAFFETNENLPEKIIEYYIWFDAVDGKTVIQSSENKLIGWVSEKDNTPIKQILLEHIPPDKK